MLLALLYLRPGQDFTLSDLARRLSVSPGALHAEVARLVDAGLLDSRTVGRSRLLQANTQGRAAHAFAELLAVTFGPELVDVDVMELGRPAREDVYRAAERAEERLAMPVNPVVRSVEAWRHGSDALIITAKRDAVMVAVMVAGPGGGQGHL